METHWLNHKALHHTQTDVHNITSTCMYITCTCTCTNGNEHTHHTCTHQQTHINAFSSTLGAHDSSCALTHTHTQCTCTYMYIHVNM